MNARFTDNTPDEATQLFSSCNISLCFFLFIAHFFISLHLFRWKLLSVPAWIFSSNRPSGMIHSALRSFRMDRAVKKRSTPPAKLHVNSQHRCGTLHVFAVDHAWCSARLYFYAKLFSITSWWFMRLSWNARANYFVFRDCHKSNLPSNEIAVRTLASLTQKPCCCTCIRTTDRFCTQILVIASHI